MVEKHHENHIIGDAMSYLKYRRAPVPEPMQSVCLHLEFQSTQIKLTI